MNESWLKQMTLLSVLDPVGQAELYRLYAHSEEKELLSLSSLLSIRDLVGDHGRNDIDLHLLLLALFLRLEGRFAYLRLSVAEIARILDEFFGTPCPDRAKTIVDRVLLGDFTPVTTFSPDLSAPVIIDRLGPVPRIWFQRSYYHYARLRLNLNSIFLRDRTIGDQAIVKAIEMEKDNPALRRLNGQQKTALLCALRSDFSLISGGPGTGKTALTSVLLTLLNRLRFKAEDIVLLAPTGLAAQRLIQAANLDSTVKSRPVAMTIHRLLGYRPDLAEFSFGPKNKLSPKVFIIDEVSMIDLETLVAFLDAAPTGAKMVFLGDRDQLPAISVGHPLFELIPSSKLPPYSDEFCRFLHEVFPEVELSSSPITSMTDRINLLEHNYRSVKSINDLALAVKNGNVALLEGLSCFDLPDAHQSKVKAKAEEAASELNRTEAMTGCFRIAPKSSSHWQEIVTWWTDRFLFSPKEPDNDYRSLLYKVERMEEGLEETSVLVERLLDLHRKSKILCPTHLGPQGCIAVNNFIGDRLGKLFSSKGRDGFISGLPIILERNYPALGLFNGETGILLSHPGNVRRIWFRKGDRLSPFNPEQIRGFSSAFAITIHKSQGSEYDRVLLPLPPAKRKDFIDTRLIYTGITRARSLLILYASLDNLVGIKPLVETLDPLLG